MSWIHINVFLPLCEPERHRGLGRRLSELQRFDGSTEAEQRSWQARRVRALLAHACEATPYYRELFRQASFTPAMWRDGEAIPVPVLTRDIMRAANRELKSTHVQDELRPAVTGGTTGTPINLFRDVEGLRQKTALQYHLDRSSGFDHGDRVLLIWGAERDLVLHPSWRRTIYEQLLMRRVPAPAGQISEGVFAGFLEKLQRHKPKVLYGYSATMARFAEYVRCSGRPYHRPSVIIATAEALTDPDRALLEATFGCKVTEHYGSRDIGMVAAECKEHAGLHFHPLASFVEFAYAGETPDGPMYKLLVTDLLNRGMPLIRYDTDDCVLLASEPCRCGRWFPRIRRILGRGLDNFLLQDGTQVPGIALTVHMAKVSGGFRNVTQVQVVQKTMDHILIRYAAVGESASIDQELARLRACVEEMLRTPVQWSFLRVPEILRESSGKLRLCISEVSSAPHLPA
jgi:phenylacetate-CoA ligase